MIVLWLAACSANQAWIGDQGFATADHAVQASVAGETIELAPGRHLARLVLPHPLTLVGDRTVLDAEGFGANLIASADVELDGITFQGGMSAGPVLDIAGELVAHDVLIDGARGLTTLHVGSGLEATGLYIDSPHATTAIRSDGGRLWLDGCGIDVPFGGSLVAGRAATASITDTELVDFWGALVRADTIDVHGVSTAASLVLEAEHISVSDVSARRLSLTGAGIARDIDVASLGSTGVDVLAVTATEVLSLRQATARTVRMGSGEREPTIALSESSVDGLLVRDEATVYGLSPMFLTFGRNRVSHLTWLGGQRTVVTTEGELDLDQSIIAGTRLHGIGTRFITSTDTFGWGHGLPWTTSLMVPWAQLEPQLDGDDLAPDSVLWGVGQDGQPGAFGGPWGLTDR